MHSRQLGNLARMEGLGRRLGGKFLKGGVKEMQGGISYYVNPMHKEVVPPDYS